MCESRAIFTADSTQTTAAGTVQVSRSSALTDLGAGFIATFRVIGIPEDMPPMIPP